MTIGSGNLIVKGDYNSIRNLMTSVLGTTGTGDIGYGMTPTAETVETGDLISTSVHTAPPPLQWNYLYADMLKIAGHQNTSIATLTTAYNSNVGVGKVIQAPDIALFASTATTLYNNRLNLGTGQYTDGYFSPDISNSRTASWGSPSIPTVQHSFNITFTSYDAARYYFNAGGGIFLRGQRYGGSSNPQNTDWTTMLDSMGTIFFLAHSTTCSGTGTGSPSIGFYELTGTAQQIFTKGGNPPGGGGSMYAANDYTIYASRSGAVVTFTVYFNDDHTNGFSDSVDGTLVSTVGYRVATGANVTTLAPTATNTTILSNGVVTPGTTYNVTPASSNVNEGSSLTFNISGSNITNGTYYWTITNSGDFGTSSGSFTITSNSGSFSVTPTADSTTEGSETFTASIRSDSTSGTVLATSSPVIINDTSTTPGTPSYIVTPASSTVNEGSNLTFNVSGSNITNGTYYYSVNYSGSADVGDFNALNAAGSFTITSNSGSFFVTTIADQTLEGAQTFSVNILTGSTNGTVVATSSPVTINDTSTTPVSPSYIVTPASSTVNEGSNLTFNVSGSNITNGTYYYSVNYSGSADVGDFNALNAAGSFTITSNSGSFFVTTIADQTLEGAQTFSVNILTGSTNGTVVATSSPVTINDTSYQPPNPTVSYVSTIAQNTNFSWSMTGQPNENVDIVMSGANSLNVTITLNGSGSYSNGGTSFFINAGTTNLTFTFTNTSRVDNQVVTKTVIVT